MKTKLACFSLLLMLSTQTAWAAHTAMIGGARDGLGLGMETRREFGPLTGRFGVEATTGEDLTVSGDNPFIFWAGVSHPLLKDKPVSGSLGFIGYFGNRSEQGVYGSLLIDQLNGNPAIYAEPGFDWFGDHGHVFLQVGYRFLPENW